MGKKGRLGLGLGLGFWGKRKGERWLKGPPSMWVVRRLWGLVGPS